MFFFFEGGRSELFRKAQSSTAIEFRKPRIFRWSCGAEQETEETMAAAPAIFDNLWSFWGNCELAHVGTENPTPKNVAGWDLEDVSMHVEPTL